MSRIQTTFDALRRDGRKALIPYITAGDPDLRTTATLMQALVDCGADILELGVPFSDPSSDGPVIQRAVERALARGTTLRDVLALVKEFRQSNQSTPVVLMGYLNPIEYLGYPAFAEAASEAGVDGVLVVDMPPEEADELHGALQAKGVDSIFLVAPTTREERARAICKNSSGFVYYVSLKGVTGAGHLDIEEVERQLARLRGWTDLPLGVGFGIHDAQSAARIARVADAVVVGSALVARIAELQAGENYCRQDLSQRLSLLRDMRQAMDAATTGAGA